MPKRSSSRADRMMDREPFAVVVPVLGRKGTVFGERMKCGGIDCFPLLEVGDIALVSQINNVNSAFEKAVTARVKEAVEEFRERAAKMAETRTDGDWQGHTIADEIRAMPTEPEGQSGHQCALRMALMYAGGLVIGLVVGFIIGFSVCARGR